LFAKLIVQARYMAALPEVYEFDARGKMLMLLPLIIASLVFALHIVFLIGMYQLRRLIYENNQKKIDDEFISER
jgi:hypothetical protein